MDSLHSFPIHHTLRRYVLKDRERFFKKRRYGTNEFCASYLEAFMFFTKYEAKDYAINHGLYELGFRPRSVLIPDPYANGQSAEGPAGRYTGQYTIAEAAAPLPPTDIWESVLLDDSPPISSRDHAGDGNLARPDQEFQSSWGVSVDSQRHLRELSDWYGSVFRLHSPPNWRSRTENSDLSSPGWVAMEGSTPDILPDREGPPDVGRREPAQTDNAIPTAIQAGMDAQPYSNRLRPLRLPYADFDD